MQSVSGWLAPSARPEGSASTLSAIDGIDWEGCKAYAAEQAGSGWSGTIEGDALDLHPLFSTKEMVGPCFV